MQTRITAFAFLASEGIPARDKTIYSGSASNPDLTIDNTGNLFPTHKIFLPTLFPKHIYLLEGFVANTTL